MAARPSEPLLKILRDTVKKRGLSTVHLSAETGIDRSELKKKLAGQLDLTVDDFLRLAEALGLTDEVVAMQRAGKWDGSLDATSPETEEEASHEGSPLQLHALRPGAPAAAPPAARYGLDPEGNPARQLVESGFALGLDMFLHFDRKQLEGSGVPPSVLTDRRFVELLPIKLEARFHRHNRPEFWEEAFRCTLSFDALYTCTFPWRGLRQVGFTLPPETEPDPAPAEEPVPSRPVLRLVKD